MFCSEEFVVCRDFVLFHLSFPDPSCPGPVLGPSHPTPVGGFADVGRAPIHFSLAFMDQPSPNWVVGQGVSQSHPSHAIPWKKKKSLQATSPLTMMPFLVVQAVTDDDSIFTYLSVFLWSLSRRSAMWTPKGILARTHWQTQVLCAGISGW